MIQTLATKHVFALLAGLALAQTPEPPPESPIVAQSLPAIAEPSWTFADGNAVYFVGKQTGTLTIIRTDGRPSPAPRPQPQPTPPPVVVKQVTWATLVLPAATLSPEMAALRTDGEIRKAMDAAKITYRSYLDTEEDVERLQFKPYATGIPALILQDKDGTVISAKPIQDKAGIINAIR